MKSFKISHLCMVVGFLLSSSAFALDETMDDAATTPVAVDATDATAVSSDQAKTEMMVKENKAKPDMDAKARRKAEKEAKRKAKMEPKKAEAKAKMEDKKSEMESEVKSGAKE